MLNVKKILTKMLEKTIVEDILHNHIKIGSFAMCWGTATPTSINSQNAVTFPITFVSAPHGFATFRGDAKGNTHNQICVKNETTTGMTVYYYEAGGAVKQFNWLAVGFIGGGYFLKVFSRLAERRWEHAEREETSHEYDYLYEPGMEHGHNRSQWWCKAVQLLDSMGNEHAERIKLIHSELEHYVRMVTRIQASGLCPGCGHTITKHILCGCKQYYNNRLHVHEVINRLYGLQLHNSLGSNRHGSIALERGCSYA